MNLYLSVIRECLETGISPRCHLEDITRSDIYGFVIPFCVELMKLMDEYKIPIKIRACDTMGFGVTYPGTALPRSVQGIISGLRHDNGELGAFLDLVKMGGASIPVRSMVTPTSKQWTLANLLLELNTEHETVQGDKV